ncbi:phage tail tube protein [Salimicrobium halophilum]|uniref:Phage tail tube protein n=1 Tax=Salimicrobium halophilum TaxID=86666 RepID=A0A1G8WD73_9BACI|nr:phage tail tube protein [Salimicrobium halophilum]SDJ76228.1 Phage tail tube protein [Salimicrobium halophilum]
MRQKYTGGEQINGKNGMVWWDGEPIFEVEAFEATITAEREAVNLAMKSGAGTKLTGTTGEGTLTIKKMFTRGMRRFVEAWKRGEDPISTMTSLLDDPQTPDGQAERSTMERVWINELPLTTIAHENMTQEIGFGFDPDFVDVQETIDPV